MNFLKKTLVTLLAACAIIPMAACGQTTGKDLDGGFSAITFDDVTTTWEDVIEEDIIEEDILVEDVRTENEKRKDYKKEEVNALDNLLVIDVMKIVDGKFMSRGAYANPDMFIYTISLNKNIVDVTFKDNYYCLVLNQRVGDRHVLVEVTFDDYVHYLELMCGTTYVKVDKSILEINKPQLTEMELLQLEYDNALKNCDFKKLQEVINKIIELQDKNGCSMTTETVIFVGRVYNCTTTYDVIEDANLIVGDIRSKSFGDRFPYEKIQMGNVTRAIQKATGYSDQWLKENNILVTISGNDGNGYDFYLIKVEF